MIKLHVVISIVFLSVLTSCSHNQGSLIAGKGLMIGGQGIQYFNGLVLLDNSRENSSWKIEIDDEDGITMQDGNVRGVRNIERSIRGQITGYACDMAKECPDAVTEYLKGVNADAE